MTASPPPAGGTTGDVRSRIERVAELARPEAWLLHHGMGNYEAVWAHGFDPGANPRLDPQPLYTTQQLHASLAELGFVVVARADVRRATAALASISYDAEDSATLARLRASLTAESEKP